MTDILHRPQEEAQYSLPESSVNFEVLKNPYDRMEYVHLTDKLIHRLEGSDVDPAPDVVLFLDKSARPVSWLTSELWDTLAREPGTDYNDNRIPKKPQFIFLNIDSKHNFLPEDIPGLRSLFTVDPVNTLDGIENKSTFLDGKNVLIIDEIGVSHATRVKATAYMQLAFPEATVEGYTWMDQGPSTQYGGQGRPPSFDKELFRLQSATEPGIQAKQLDNNLRWYKDRSHLPMLDMDEKRRYDDGRAILDHDSATPEELAGLERKRTALGKQWVSVAPAELMPGTIQVRKEIKMMAAELKSGTLPYWPDGSRDDVEQRCEEFNGIGIADFTQFRVWFKEAWWKNWNDAPVIAALNKPVAEAYNRLPSKSEAVVRFAIKHALYEG